MNNRNIYKDQGAFDRAMSIFANGDEPEPYVQNIKDSIGVIRTELDNIEKELDTIQDLKK